MNIQDFKLKWLRYLNEWECNLLVYQKLCNNFQHRLFDESKIESVREDIFKDLDSLNLEEANQQDLYEEAIRLACESGGHTFGEHYTPGSIKEVVGRIVKSYDQDYPNWQRIYDPTCGTGGLLLSVPDKQNYTGIEIRREVALLCDMHLKAKYPNSQVNIINTSSLEHDFNSEDLHDIVVANPPFSLKWEPREGLDFDGVYAPKSKADWAFIKHMINSVKDDGIVVSVVFPGTLYRAQSEERIRKKLLEKNLIEAMILLPENMFNFTTIATAILVLRKNRSRKDIFIAEFKDNQTRKKGKTVELTKEAIDYFSYAYCRFVNGGYTTGLEDRSNSSVGIKVVDAKDIHPDSFMRAFTDWVSDRVKDDDVEYEPSVYDPAFLVRDFLKFRNILKLEEEVLSIFSSNSTRTLFLKEFKPFVDEFHEKYRSHFDEVFSNLREWKKSKSIAEDL